MNARHVVLATLVAGLSAGCSTTFHPFAPPEIPPCKGRCDIPVSPIAGPPSEVIISEGRGEPITWKLGLNGLFAKPGIVFKRIEGGTPSNCETSRDEKQVTCVNSGVPGRYEYAVHFSNGRHIDPWVVNQ